MSEMTIAMPLSGEEIKEAVKDKIDQIMVRDCRLNPALAYPAFRCTIWIELDIDDGTEGRTKIEIDTMVQSGSSAQLERTAKREGYGELEERPPNVVRQAAGLPIPTLVEDSEGRREVRPVKYAKRTEHEGEHEKKDKEHEHDPKKPAQPGQPQQPGQSPHTGPETPKR